MANSPEQIEIGGFRPGAIGDVIALHGRYYDAVWGLDQRFEAEVARELGAFAAAFDACWDGFWLACNGDTTVGSITIDGNKGAAEGARLRWFILHPDYHGQGLGRRLFAEALEFCREKQFARVYLATFAGLDAARRLYEGAGFRLISEQVDTDWNEGGVTHQTFELLL